MAADFGLVVGAPPGGLGEAPAAGVLPVVATVAVVGALVFGGVVGGTVVGGATVVREGGTVDGAVGAAVVAGVLVGAPVVDAAVVDAVVPLVALTETGVDRVRLGVDDVGADEELDATVDAVVLGAVRDVVTVGAFAGRRSRVTAAMSAWIRPACAGDTVPAACAARRSRLSTSIARAAAVRSCAATARDRASTSVCSCVGPLAELVEPLQDVNAPAVTAVTPRTSTRARRRPVDGLTAARPSAAC